MLDTAAQSRYARSCTDAAFGYVAAANSAWLEMTRQSLTMWSSAVQAFSPVKPEPRSWYRHPDERPAAAMQAFAWPAGPASPPALSPWLPAPAVGFPSPMQYLAPWMSMLSSPRAMTAWPMAFMMISIGVPETVARPAAEANAAALEAATIAAEAAKRSFSAYRSDGGHASAHVVGGDRLVMTALLPFATLPFLR